MFKSVRQAIGVTFTTTHVFLDVLMDNMDMKQPPKEHVIYLQVETSPTHYMVILNLDNIFQYAQQPPNSIMQTQSFKNANKPVYSTVVLIIMEIHRQESANQLAKMQHSIQLIH